ncbi:hypothetical protein K488DRAFT_64352 [Vararia minispora EC-137]|uniref:Uncharacterized protein n=1 Tax=Vararia minispora EC-137 TaxID=1314806 RepID=A0ACB8Q5T5_9AGAM|nr:hypothetical protein K488DRAFT_64352 [Vararia minispora EC-137]
MFAVFYVRRHTHTITKRTLSTHAFSSSPVYNAFRNFAGILASRQPHFSVSPGNVRVLGQPDRFYAELLRMIRSARKRIFISSLYIGSTENELIDTLRMSLERTPALEVHLQLDYNRSTRPGRACTATLLLPLLYQFPDRVHVSLFRSPKLKGFMAKLIPPRFNEGWGTWHAKIYGADEDVMISGANLNRSYFTDRQDRYLYFAGESGLADYCFSYLKTASSFSFKLLWPQEVAETGALPSPLWTEPSVHPQRIERMAGDAFRALQASHRQRQQLPLPATDARDEALVFPVIQAGQFSIKEEEECIKLLFHFLTDAVASQSVSVDFKPLVNLTSGYFGLYKSYQDLILQSPVDTRIVCASPLANGFYGSKGVSGLIPEGYTLLEKRFMRAVHRARRAWTQNASSPDSESGVELTEWHRDAWTYHAKGLWVSPTHTAPPLLTLFGSTNLNSRSAHLDAELSFVMLTSSAGLREQLRAELATIRAHSGPWRGAERHVRLMTRVLAGLVDGML